MAVQGFLVVSLLFSCFAVTSYAAISFSSIQQSLTVTASPKAGEVLEAGDDNITVTWSFNKSLPAGTDSSYKTVKFKLCYAPISQEDRAWRKTEDHLNKDKTCQHNIVTKPYSSSDNNNFTWTVERDVPTATYFIRAYVLNSEGHEVAYGQTTDAKKSANLFSVQAISGRHVSLDIASICFSAFAVVSLFGFFFLREKEGQDVPSKVMQSF